MALTKKQIQTIECGDQLKRKSEGLAEVHDVIKATSGEVAAEIDSYWDEGETKILDTYEIQKQFIAIM